MRTCAIIHPLHLELETAPLIINSRESNKGLYGCKRNYQFVQRSVVVLIGLTGPRFLIYDASPDLS